MQAVAVAVRWVSTHCLTTQRMHERATRRKGNSPECMKHSSRSASMPDHCFLNTPRHKQLQGCSEVAASTHAPALTSRALPPRMHHSCYSSPPPGTTQQQHSTLNQQTTCHSNSFSRQASPPAQTPPSAAPPPPPATTQHNNNAAKRSSASRNSTPASSRLQRRSSRGRSRNSNRLKAPHSR